MQSVMNLKLNIEKALDLCSLYSKEDASNEFKLYKKSPYMLLVEVKNENCFEMNETQKRI